jgi:uncharacterized protein YkwD
MRTDVGPCRRSIASIFIAACAALLTALCATPASAADCANADAMPGQASHQAMSDATLCLLNNERAANGLNALVASDPLTQTASRYSSYMVARKHFGHVDEEGHDVVDRVAQTAPALDGRWSMLGENLGYGTMDMASPRGMVDGWMQSSVHRANILRPDYQEIGIGIADGAPMAGASGGATYTTVFGKVNTSAGAAKSSATSAKLRPSARQCRRARRSHSHSARMTKLRKACAAKARAARR